MSIVIIFTAFVCRCILSKNPFCKGGKNSRFCFFLKWFLLIRKVKFYTTGILALIINDSQRSNQPEFVHPKINRLGIYLKTLQKIENRNGKYEDSVSLFPVDAKIGLQNKAFSWYDCNSYAALKPRPIYLD